MKLLIPQGKSLKYYGLLSWVVPGVIAIVACGLIFVGFTSYSLHAEQKRIETLLIEKSTLAARRVSAELLLGDRGNPNAIIRLLLGELNVSGIQLDSEPICAGAEYCFTNRENIISIHRKIPALPEATYLSVDLPAPAWSNLFSIGTLVWATLPIVLMFLVGVFFQRYILRRYFLQPVQALIETSKGDRDARDYWPEEIQNISKQLASSFQVRDQEVFAQIARGVIHDLRTLIHAPLASVDLVDEVENNPEKRLRRLESLKTICAQQLPKMREIIDHTLDGSRDVSIRASGGNISNTLIGVSKTLESLAKQSNAELIVSDATRDFVFAHDAVQVERAITNLAKNAIEASQETLSGKRVVRVRAEAAEQSIKIHIEDSGPGLKIAPSRLFRPLKSTKPHGSGLGLIVTRKIIEAHGGTIDFSRSADFGGAHFTVNLPAKDAGGAT
ncbi:MAG: HAMP domain-containing histidine kinase [Bdellovibrionales bacterium]|nr:HAMP domain-containing histidine kinase [Bdellovibrionales bacterium]